jgi:FtsH-binding integral membrane protein
MQNCHRQFTREKQKQRHKGVKKHNMLLAGLLGILIGFIILIVGPSTLFSIIVGAIIAKIFFW